MKIVHLSDSNGKVIKKYVGFSYLFFFFGPFYLLVKFRLLSALILFLLYYYLLPIPGMDLFSNLITPIFNENTSLLIGDILLFFRGESSKIIGITSVIIIQFILSFFIEGFLIKKRIKKEKLLPVSEDDARLLISVHACSRKVKLSSSLIQTDRDVDIFSKKIIDVPYIISEDNSEVAKLKQNEKRKKIQELNELYRLGNMSREEYEIRRTRIVKQYK